MGDIIAQTRFESVSKHSNDSLLARGNTLQSDKDRLEHNELMALCSNLQTRVLDLEKIKTTQKSSEDEESLGKDASKQGRRIDATDQDEDITLVNVQDDAEMFDVNDLGSEKIFVADQEVVKDVNENVVEEVVNACLVGITTRRSLGAAADLFNQKEPINAAQDSTARTTITIKEITLSQAFEALKTSKSKVKGIVIQEQEEPSKSTTTTATITKQQSQDKGKGIMIEEPVKPKKKDQIKLDEEVTKRAFKRLNTFEDIRTKLVKGKEKRAGEELIQESTKKQKVEEDKEIEKLKQLMEIIPDKEEVVIDAIPLAVNKMLKSFHKEYLEDLYKLVKAKFKSTRPVEDLELLLWGDLKAMFEPHVEDKPRWDYDPEKLSDQKEPINAAQDSTATTTITNKEITLSQAFEALKTSKPKVKGIVIQEQEEPSKSTTTTIATITIQQSHDKGKGIMIEEPVKPKQKDQIKLDEEVTKRLQAEFDEGEILAREKESTKKQKVEEDKEMAKLKQLMEIIPDKEEVAIDAIPLAGAARRWLEQEPPCSILTWEDLVSKFINEFFPPSRTTNLRNEISNFQQRFDESFHEACDRYKDLLRARPHHGFTELHQLDAFYNALNLADQDSLNSATGGNLLERRTQDVLTIIENKSKCLAVGGNTFPKLRDNIQGYVSAAAVNYNQGNSIYRPPGSGSLPSNIVANPKGELKAITTQSGIVLDGPFVPTPPSFIILEVDEHVEETLTDQDLSEDPLHPNIPYPSRMLKQKQQEKDEVQIHKFWQMFKQLHINITLADALILMPKYQKMLKALPSNKEKLQELANTPLNDNCSAVILKKLPKKLGDPGKFLIPSVILKKLPKKLGDPGKFLIPCGFNELKCKALADFGASINLIPLYVWKKL
nr:reverse transcriptase domain-containing protein [Tanacetum cinerariifolium]